MEECIVYLTIDGWTYRVLDDHDEYRFGDIFETREEAIRAANEEGYIVRRVIEAK